MAASRPAAGGGRWVEVPPERLARWLDGFAARHGDPAVAGTTYTAPDGAVAQRLGVFTAGVLLADVPLRDSRTPATRLGVLPELALALLGAGALAVAAVRR